LEKFLLLRKVRSRDINAENVGGLSMIEVRITNWMYEKAKELAMNDKYKFGTSKNTRLDIVSDDSRLVGKLGEVVISCYFNIPLTNTKDYDIIINQERVEIKSQNLTKGIPKRHFRCDVLTPSIDFDRYMFVIVHTSYTKAWIVGTCSKDEFEYNKHYGCPLIIEWKNGLVYKETDPCFFILINELEDVESWQSKFGRTAGVYGLMRRQADS
jgi:hypothetical protein